MDINMRSSNTAAVSLSDATKPLLVVSRLVGMNPKTHLHKIYTVFILVIEISILYYIWQYYIGMQYTENYYFNVLLHVLEDLCRVISLLNILGTGLFDQNRFTVPLEDFASIDRRLTSVNGFIDNRGTYRFQISLGIYLGLMLLILGSLEFSLHILPTIDNNNRAATIVALDHFYGFMATIICAVMDYSFSITLSIIEKRFKEINLIINRAEKRGSYMGANLLEVLSARTDNHVLGVLRILRIQYHDLWSIAHRVNRAYGLHLLVGATSSLALITSHLWSSYVVFMNIAMRNSTSIARHTLWAIFNVMRMLILVMASESTVTQAKATFGKLQKLEMKGDNDYATKNEIRDFLTQLQFEAQKFTAWGFFDIDYTLICGILGAACTYLVILIQMSTPNDCAIYGYSNKSIHLNAKDDS